MSSRRATSGDSPSPWFLRRREQQLVAALTLLLQVGLLAAWFWWGGKQDLVDIDHQRRRDVRFTIDINAASASEFALLPDIGPTLAARIVAWRDEHGKFRSIDELRNVRGIGPKTFEKMLPYLAPVDSSPIRVQNHRDSEPMR